MTGMRVLLRLARRDARRDRGRSLLVLVMVALPVAGLVATITFGDSATPTVQQQATARMGAAGAIATAGGPDSDPTEFVRSLPRGTKAEVVSHISGTIVADGVLRAVEISDPGMTAGSLSAGLFAITDGRAPASTQEVAVSRAVAQAAGLQLGDSLDVEPLGPRTVVGVVLDGQHLSRRAVVAAPTSLGGSPASSPYSTTVLLDSPRAGGAPRFGDLAFAPDQEVVPANGWFVETRLAMTAQGRVTRGQGWALTVVGGLAGVEVALVAGAAFAVSVRRRQRELGLLAAGGATTSQVRTAVLLSGVTVGVAGAAAGVAFGIGGAWALLQTSLVERVLDQQVAGLVVNPGWVILCAGMGACAAIAGAWWPARSVARLPVLTALSGRRPVSTPSRRTAIRGLFVIALGAAVTMAVAGQRNGATPFIFLVGSILVVLGTGLTSPFLLEQLGRLAARLPTGPRLALRDAARFRTRNGPIVTAAMAGLAASITVAAGLGTAHANNVAQHEPILPATMAIIDGPERVLDTASAAAAAALAAEVHPLTLVGGELRGTGAQSDVILSAYSVTPELAAILAGPEAAAAITNGQLLSLDPAVDGRWHLVDIDSETGAAVPGPPVLRLDVAELPQPSGPLYTSLPVMLVGTKVFNDAPVKAAANSWNRRLLIADAPLTPAQIAAAGSAVAGVSDELFIQVERGPDTTYQRLQWAAALIGALAGLLIVAVAIALAATEARSDLGTLTAVGAGAGTRRSVAAGRALLLSGLGGILAVPVGMVPALAVLSIAAFVVPVVIPWGAIAIVALGVPAVATVGAVIVASLNSGRFARV